MKNLSRGTVQSLYELLSSMRLAVGLLTIAAIASIIGTVLKQNEPYPNYIIEFGNYWFHVFDSLGLYDVYHSFWFLSILGFLIFSISLCVVRNGPVFLKEMRNYRNKASETSLAAITPRAEFEASTANIAAMTDYLSSQGFRYKVCPRDNNTTLIAAKKGTANKLGYFLAHLALIVIAIGGLLDSNLPLKLAEFFGHIVPETRNLPQKQIPAHSRLKSSNLSFRGNVTIAENHSADVVFLNAGDGYLVQELPFIITLNHFIVDYYSNGMPKVFASEIMVTDKTTGHNTLARVAVNHPLVIDGIAIYQASFGDGGSALRFNSWQLNSPQTAPIKLLGTSVAKQLLNVNGQEYTLEFGELRVFNVEDTSPTTPKQRSFAQRLQDARDIKHDQQRKNVGPSITFKLRDRQGQAREFHHYISPIQQDGADYILAGVRSTVSEPFQYLRLPLDEQLSLDTFMYIRAAIMNSALYDDIARKSTTKAIRAHAISNKLRVPFEQSIKWILTRFAAGGFEELEAFIDKRVPADKRAAVAQTYIKILQAAMIDVMEVAHEKNGIKPLIQNTHTDRFLFDSLLAISALQHYGAPVFLQITGFDQVQASGLQLTRSPGKILVYIGSLMLVLGIVFMFYIREVRLWILLSSNRVKIAMTANRRNDQLDNELARHADKIKQCTRGA